MIACRAANRAPVGTPERTSLRRKATEAISDFYERAKITTTPASYSIETFAAMRPTGVSSGFGCLFNLERNVNGGVHEYRCKLCNSTSKADGKTVLKHIRTGKHQAHASAYGSKSTARVDIATTAAEHGTALREQRTLTLNLKERATVVAATKGYPFTAAASMLDVTQSFVSDVTGGKTTDTRAIGALMKLADESDNDVERAGFKHAAACLRRLNVSMTRVTRNQEGSVGPLTHHRTTTSREVTNTEEHIDKEYSKSAKKRGVYCMTLDESASIKKTDPCYVGIILCTDDFNWAAVLVGQTDTSRHNTGLEFIEGVAEVLNKHGYNVQDVEGGTFDGCAALSSTRKHQSYRARSEGESFRRHLNDHIRELRRKNGHQKGPNYDGIWIHCLLHIIALGLDDAMKLMPPRLIKCLRQLHTNFSRSPKQWAKLVDISVEQSDRVARLAEVVDIGQTSSWAVHQHPFPCLTRWKDLLRSQNVALGNWPALMIFKTRLIANGGGPPARRLSAVPEVTGTEETEDGGSDGEVEDADADADADAETDDDGTEGPLLDAQGRTIWKPDPALVGGKRVDWKELEKLEAGKVGNVNCSKAKRHQFLDPDAGVNDTNWGLISMAQGVFRVQCELVDKLQIRDQPISHLCARWLRAYFSELDALSDPATHDAVYEAWRKAMLADSPGYPKQGLVDSMDDMLKVFVAGLVDGNKSRLVPHDSLLRAMEMVDPRTDLSAYSSDDWAACKDICVEAGLSFAAVKADLVKMHSACESAWGRDPCSRKSMRENMLRFYNDEQDGLLGQFSNGMAYAKAVFQKPVVSVVVECWFSTMKYNQGSKRPNLGDDKTAAIVKARCLTNPVADPMKPEPARIDWGRALRHVLPVFAQV